MWALLAIGFAAALATFLWGRTRGVSAERRLYALILIVMQALYVGFVLVKPSLRAFTLEIAVLLLCWGLAAGSRRGWSWLLPAGYLSHGLWDLRHAWLVTDYVPSGYAQMCLAYDWPLMVYFLVRLRSWSRS